MLGTVTFYVPVWVVVGQVVGGFLVRQYSAETPDGPGGYSLLSGKRLPLANPMPFTGALLEVFSLFPTLVVVFAAAHPARQRKSLGSFPGPLLRRRAPTSRLGAYLRVTIASPRL